VASGQNAEFITLARVVKTQGRYGEVAAELHSDVPDRFYQGMKVLALGESGEIESFWPHKEWIVFKFCGIDSISAAEVLIGAELQVPQAERSRLEQGWTYVSDLVGCVVLDRDREIGRIEHVQLGAGEAPLLIIGDSANRKFDVPFADAYLEAVDTTRKQVRMNLPEGMLEINAPMTAEEKQQQGIESRKKKGKEY
jgi:16S rRNA processing protein RimM